MNFEKKNLFFYFLIIVSIFNFLIFLQNKLEWYRLLFSILTLVSALLIKYKKNLKLESQLKYKQKQQRFVIIFLILITSTIIFYFYIPLLSLMLGSGSLIVVFIILMNYLKK